MSTITNPPIPEAEKLVSAKAAWRSQVEAELKGAPFEKKLLTRTFEGIVLQPLYTRADTAGLPTGPRAAPRSGAWLVAQEIAAPDAVVFNKLLREDLMLGQDTVALVARSAARPDGLELGGDLSIALEGIALEAVPVQVSAGPCAAAAGASLLDIARRNGVAGAALSGSVTADPVAELAAGGGLPMSLTDAYDSLAAWTKRASVEAPALKTIGVEAALWAEAGGTAVHELGYGLATVVAQVRELAARGVTPAEAFARLRVTLAAGPQFLMETAKFRAWRPLLARVAAAYGAEASSARLQAATTRWNKTRLDPQVNMLRVTTEAFSAVLGGVDALHLSPYDALGAAQAGDPMARRVARNVHALLAEEFGAVGPADPAGGSWCIESLTEELSRKAWALFQEVEKAGGMIAALRAGEPQRALAAAAKEKAQAVGTRRYGLVGTNLFPNLRETPLPAIPTPAPVSAAFDPVVAVKPFRAAAAFEAMRDASAAYAARTGARPKVFLAKMGPVLQHKARADFTTGFFAPGGFEMAGKQTFADAAEAGRAAAASGAAVAVLCSTDDTYPTLVPEFCAAARGAKPELTLVLAGLPADEATKSAFTAAGIDLFIHLRAPVEETNANLLKKIGAL